MRVPRLAVAVALLLVSTAAGGEDGGAPSAYQALVQELETVEKDLVSSHPGYFGVRRRQLLGEERDHLRRIQTRLLAYARAVPLGCRRTAAGGTAGERSTDPANRRATAGSGPVPTSGSEERQRAVFCRPRGEPPDELVALVRGSEDAKRRLRRLQGEHASMKKQEVLQREILMRERELARRGVPSDALLPVDTLQPIGAN